MRTDADWYKNFQLQLYRSAGGAKFVGTWAILQKFAVTLPTSFVLSHLVKLLHSNPLLDYIILFTIGYSISTPLIFLTYYITMLIYGKKG